MSDLEAKLLADTLVSKSGYLDTQSAHPNDLLTVIAQDHQVSRREQLRGLSRGA
jgi:hypothetical protein